MKRKIQIRSSFKKDIKRVKKAGHKLDELFDVVEKLASDIPLESKYKDHLLKGNYKDCRECHINPDWILIYEKKDRDKLILILNRTGSHSDLF